ncbi:MAG: universal stress protein [Cyanobacteria bacterium J06582_2]
MISKILVAIDHSAGSKQVFEKALSIAKADGANLILLHVLSMDEGGSPSMSRYLVQHKNRCIHVDPRIMRQANEVDNREWSEFKQKGIELLRSYSKKAIAAGIQTEFTQITGQPSSTICEFARSCHADVIAIGRRGHSGLQEMFLGSVSNYVVHHAPCSILLVQTPILEESKPPNSVETTVYAQA